MLYLITSLLAKSSSVLLILRRCSFPHRDWSGADVFQTRTRFSSFFHLATRNLLSKPRSQRQTTQRVHSQNIMTASATSLLARDNDAIDPQITAEKCRKAQAQGANYRSHPHAALRTRIVLHPTQYPSILDTLPSLSDTSCIRVYLHPRRV